MSIDWKSVNDPTLLPGRGARVLVCDEASGRMWCARLTTHGWVDSESKPLRHLTHWSFVNGPDGAHLK